MVELSLECTGEQVGQTQPLHSGSQWIGQQLHKAYKGLTSSLSVANTPPGQVSAPRTSKADTHSHRNMDQQSQQHSAAQPQQDSDTVPDQTHRAPQSTQSPHEEERSDQSAADQHEATNYSEQAGHVSGAQQQQGSGDSHQHDGHHANEQVPQPPVAGNEGDHAAVEPQEPQGVPDRVPAAVALESSEEPSDALAAPTDQQAGHGSHAAEEDAQELDEPAVVEPQQQQKDQKKSATPVFVPIVVAMDAQDHKVMVEEWYSRQMVTL